MRTGCTNCAQGTASNPGASECATCDHLAGYVATGTENDQCEYCGPGFKADQTAHDCVVCEVSKYSVGGVNECLPCVVGEGKVQGNVGQSSCEFCGAGKKAEGNECVVCEAGTFSLGGSDSCTSCVADEGKVQGNVGQSNCNSCGAGKKAVAGTTNACMDCAASKSSEGGG